MQQVRRPGQVLAHGSVLAPMTRETDANAEIAITIAAGPARAAPDRRVDRHPLTAPGSVLDHAGRFMAEHQRFREGGVADAGLSPPVQVRAADADRGDPHQARPWSWHRHRLISQPEIAGAVQPCGLHSPLTLDQGTGKRHPLAWALSWNAAPPPRAAGRRGGR